METYVDAGWTKEKFYAYYNAYLYQHYLLRYNDMKQEAEDLWCDYQSNLQAFLRYDDKWIQCYRLPAGDALPQAPPMNTPDLKARSRRVNQLMLAMFLKRRRGASFGGIRGVFTPFFDEVLTPMEEDEDMEHQNECILRLSTHRRTLCDIAHH